MKSLDNSIITISLSNGVRAFDSRPYFKHIKGIQNIAIYFSQMSVKQFKIKINYFFSKIKIGDHRF